MNAYHVWLNSLVNANKIKFAEFTINWLNPYQSNDFTKKREDLTENLKDNWLFKHTKPYYNQISQGCKLCGMGSWSCLFITGKCNASCFYCPAPQVNDEIPSSQQFSFPTPESYAEYINYFNFKGVSFSGGEPLLYFERVLNYLKMIRKKCNPDVYVWMYTNGIAGDEKKFRKLAHAGLNEIRFDIGATGFNLDAVKRANGIIPNVTIEIPAVPEEKEKIKSLLPDMIKSGVGNLNLHQLRLTLHNAPKLSKRNYTFIHAEQPIALESELAALEILNHAKQKHAHVGINYCSFHYKNRFQRAGFRKQMANVLAQPEDFISENGYLREKNQQGIAYKTFSVNDSQFDNKNFNQIALKNKTYCFRKETILRYSNLSENDIQSVEELLKQSKGQIPEDPFLFKIWQLEYIEPGLRAF